MLHCKPFNATRIYVEYIKSIEVGEHGKPTDLQPHMSHASQLLVMWRCDKSNQGISPPLQVGLSPIWLKTHSSRPTSL